MFKQSGYHQYLLLDPTHVVELTDHRDILWVLETKKLTVEVKSGKKTVSNWCKHPIDDLYDLPHQLWTTYQDLLDAERECDAPVAEYEVKHKWWGGYAEHRLQQYAGHVAYHAMIGMSTVGERVIIAKDATTLVEHSRGIGGLYYGLISSPPIKR